MLLPAGILLSCVLILALIIPALKVHVVNQAWPLVVLSHALNTTCHTKKMYEILLNWLLAGTPLS